MSEAKAIKVLESLGGSAELKEIRKRAKEMYPDMQLYRTIHTPLKSLLEKKKVKFRGKLQIGGSRKKRSETWWTLTDVSKVIPPVKTAAQILEEHKGMMITSMSEDEEKLWIDAAKRTTEAQKELDEIPMSMHEDVPVINTNILTGKHSETARFLLEKQEEKEEEEEKEKEEGQPVITPNGTIVHDLKAALKEPYLDKLKEVVENVEKREYKYRGRHDIIFGVLSFMKSHINGLDTGIHVTEIMYKTMLSHWQLKKYIVTLLKNDLIEKTNTGYKITAKGLHYSDVWDSIPINFD